MSKIERNSKLLDYSRESPRVIEYEKDISKLGDHIREHMDRAHEDKWIRSIQWFQNASFLSGSHYDYWRYNGSGISNDGEVFARNPYASLFVPKQVSNQLVRAVEFNVSTLTGTNPTPRITPASDHPEDESDARVAELLIQVLWEDPLRLPERLRDMVRYLCICGTAAIELKYDRLPSTTLEPKTKKEKVYDELTGEEVEEEVPTGDNVWRWRNGLRSRVWSAFQLTTNPDATDDDDSVTWIAISSYEDPTHVRRAYNRSEKGFYPENLKRMEVSSEDTNSPLWWWDELRTLMDAPDSVGVTRVTGYRSTLHPRVLVHRIYTRPNADAFPQGRLIIWAGGQVIYEGPSDVWTPEAPDRWHPLTIFRWWKQAGRWYGKPLISELVPAQKRINAIDAVLEISRGYIGIGAWMIPDRCRVPEGLIGPLPGQHLSYRLQPGGGKPERIPYQTLPSDIYNERQILISEIDAKAGINTAPQLTSAPSALRSGAMVQLYEQQALASKSGMMLDFESAIERLAEDVLRLGARFMRDDDRLLRRLAAAAKGESIAAVERFRQHGDWDGTHVSIDIRGQALLTPEAKKAAAVDFLQYAGAQISASERAQVASYMGLTELESTVTPQYDRARRVVEQVLNGNTDWATPMRVDDPSIFIEVLTEQMLSERYMIAPREVKMALDDLLTHYQTVMQQRMQAQLQAQAALQQGGAPQGEPETDQNR